MENFISAQNKDIIEGTIKDILGTNTVIPVAEFKTKFMEEARKHKVPLTETEVQNAINYFDADNSGSLSGPELAGFFYNALGQL